MMAVDTGRRQGAACVQYCNLGVIAISSRRLRDVACGIAVKIRGLDR